MAVTAPEMKTVRFLQTRVVRGPRSGLHVGDNGEHAAIVAAEKAEDVTYDEGQEYTLPVESADRWINRGVAEEVTKKASPKKTEDK